MALKDLFSFFSSDSTEKYNAKQHDPVKARAPLLRGIATARKQFNSDEFKKPNRWFSVKNEVVAFHPKLDGRTLVLNGVEENHMPSDRFVEFLDLMEKEAIEGQFDEVIAAHGKGNVDVHIGKAPRKRSTTKGMKPWEARDGYADLPRSTKQVLAGNHRVGLNPDRSPFKDGEYNPNASPIRNKEGNEL